MVGPVSDDTAETARRPRSVTIVLDPEPLAPHSKEPKLSSSGSAKGVSKASSGPASRRRSNAGRERFFDPPRY